MNSNPRLFQSVAVLRCCLVAALILTACFVSHAQKNDQSGSHKPTVLILATYHMNNPGRDVINVQADDVMTAKRQKEIRKFVNLLKRFRPTKIALEAPFGSAELGERYRQYLSGNYQLTRNEKDQIGLRLAKELNHARVYGVDAEGQFDIGKVFTFAAANNQMDVANRATEIVKRQVAETNKLMQTATITEIYRVLNSESTINEGYQPYLMMARIGKDKEYVGADLLADWYGRNLKIFSNITRVADSKDDRVLVIIGGGHVKLLQQFVEDSGEYNLEKASKYF